MSLKNLAAFLSGVGTASMPAWLVGQTYGEASIYAVCSFTVAILFISFVFDTCSQ